MRLWNARRPSSLEAPATSTNAVRMGRENATNARNAPIPAATMHATTTASSRTEMGSRGAITSPRKPPRAAPPASTANQYVGSPLRRRANAMENRRNPFRARRPAAPRAGGELRDGSQAAHLSPARRHMGVRQPKVQERGDRVDGRRAIQHGGRPTGVEKQQPRHP